MPSTSSNTISAKDLTGFAWSKCLEEAAAESQRGITHYAENGELIFQSYADLRQDSLAILGGLQRAGVAASTGVVLQAESSQDFIAGLWACFLGGYVAIPVLMPPSYALDSAPRRKVVEALNQDPGSVVLISAAQESALVNALSELGARASIHTFEATRTKSPGQLSETSLDRRALLLFTSGSTGSSKGVPLTELNLAAMAAGTVQMNGFGPDDVALNWMAADHVGAVVFLGLVPVFAGCSQVQVPTNYILQKPTRWLDLIDRHRASISWAPNFAFSLVLDSEEEIRAGKWDLSSMRFLVNAGEPIVARTARKFLRVLESRGLPADALRPAFGMSETCSGITWSLGFRLDETNDDQGFVSLGPTIPGAEMRVVDDAGNSVDSGTKGRLQMRGPSVFSGYLNREDLNAEVFSDHWFTTGDLGYLENGELFITGREKDVIIVNGANFYCHEIEGVAEDVAGIKKSYTAACGVRRNDGESEVLALFFVPEKSADSPAVAKTLRATVAQRVGVAAQYVVALAPSDVPKTEIGKIKRPALRRVFEQGEFDAQIVLRPAARRASGHRRVKRVGQDFRTLQREITAIWQDTLGLDEVSGDDTFFELGGHSLLVVDVQQALAKLVSRTVTIAELFNCPTVNTLARHFAQDGKPTESAERTALTVSGKSAGVAIVGMGCRLPGADGPAEFWYNLVNERESISFFTAEDAIAAGVDPTLARDASFVKAAPVIDGVEDFDAEFFRYSAKEASLIDPQQRLFLETCWEAFEDAGHDPLTTPYEVGLYAAAGLNTYLANNLLADPAFQAEEMGGRMLTVDSMGGFNVMITNDKDYLTTRVAYKLNLRGPVVNLQSACSSTLLAVHQAARALLDGECGMALAGGVSIKLPQYAGHQYSPGMLNSPDGHCRAYDAEAEGTIFGNGSGVVLMKRVEDAIKDGDRIYAVVRGSATNNDGGDKAGYTAPSAQGEYRVMRDAIARAGVHAETITYVEGHGTGTPLGDPIEIDALSRAFRDHTDLKQFCAVGSVKTNIGHMQIASGIAGLMKTALAVKHAQLPGTLHFQRANPQIDFEASPFFVSARTQSWETNGTPRRAGVNSLGIGGSNVHVILEEAPQRTQTEQPSAAGPFLLPLSAASPAALAALADRYADFIVNEESVALGDVCHTARIGRAQLTYRKSVVANDRDEMISALREISASDLTDANARKPDGLRVGFLVSGQGAQWPGMGRELAERFPVFAAAVAECAEILDAVIDVPIRDVMWAIGEEASSLVHQTRYTQPALFTFSYALGELYRSWGIEPDAALGHSVGEYVGAVWAGVWELEDALRVVARRGQLMQEAPGDGGMLAINLGAEDVAVRLAKAGDDLVIAGFNGVRQTVVAGEIQAIDQFADRLKTEGLRCKKLQVSHAFHSPLMESARAGLEEATSGVDLAEPAFDLVSNVTGKIEIELFTDPAYWADHLRRPVRYADGINAMLEAGVEVFLEVGPQPVLTGLSRLDHESGPATWIASSRAESGEVGNLLRAMGQLWESGVVVNWSAMTDSFPGNRVSLPTYPWQRQRYWIEGTDITRRDRKESGVNPTDPYLGHAVRLPRSDQHVFSQSATLAGMPWVADHHVHGRMVAPGAQFLAQILTAGERIGGGQPFCVRDLTFASPLVLAEGQERELQLVFDASVDGGARELELVSFRSDSDAIISHASGTWERVDKTSAASLDLSAIQAKLTQSSSVDRHFKTMEQMGITLGPDFRWIDSIQLDGQGEALFGIQRPETANVAPGWHPGMLDCSLQALVAAMPAVEGQFVPFRMREIQCLRALPANGVRWAHARWSPPANGTPSLRGEVSLLDEAGNVCVKVSGFELRAISATDVQRALGSPLEDSFWTTNWEPMPKDASAPQLAWHVIAPEEKIAQPALTALHAHGLTAAWIGGALPEAFEPGVGYLDLSTWSKPDPQAAFLTAKNLGERDLTDPYFYAVNETADPEMASAVESLWRALRWERPEGVGTVVRLTDSEAWSGFAAAADSLAAASEESVFGISGTAVSRRRIEKLPARQLPAEAIPVSTEKSYVITGGGGALGLELADWLVGEGAKYLVLNGRSVPSDNAAARISSWRDQGVAIEWVGSDLADSDGAAKVWSVARSLAPVGGWVHAAGLLRDHLLTDMSVEDFDEVWNAKARSAATMAATLPDESLDFISLYSSLSSAFGSAAQCNYASANGYLDGLAQKLRSQGRHAVSLRWGPWAEVGMTARLETSSRERLANWGFGQIDPVQVSRWIGRLLTSTNDPLILPLDLPKFSAAVGSPAPGLFSKIVATRPVADKAAAQPVISWAELSTADQQEQMQSIVRDTIAKILGMADAGAVSLTKGLFDFGIDSLSAVDLKNRLQSALGIKIPATLVFDYPTVTAIRDYLLTKVAPMEAKPVKQTASADPALEDLDEDDLEALLAKELGD
ncbi:SDR family NAD(P)-dependent oxidoreductase [Opitutaceae bacterium]|nr:SDR family NAD(P)-dependent oxidoreductase [Opitutaceae bacterium]